MIQEISQLTAEERLKTYQTILAAFKKAYNTGVNQAATRYAFSEFVCVHLSGYFDVNFRLSIDCTNVLPFFPEFLLQKPALCQPRDAWWDNILDRIEALERSIEEVEKLIGNGRQNTMPDLPGRWQD